MHIENTKDRSSQKSRLKSLIQRMRRDEEGVTAIEFGMIAAPFLFLIVALLETALIHMTTLDLENAVKDASRQIRTGQAQVANLTAAQFKDLVCDNSVLVLSCKTTPNFVVDVKSYDDFDSISMDPSDIYDEDGNFIGGGDHNMGSGLKVVVVRAYYKMELHAQIPNVGLANAGAHHRMIDSVAVFRNEPFS